MRRAEESTKDRDGKRERSRNKSQEKELSRERDVKRQRCQEDIASRNTLPPEKAVKKKGVGDRDMRVKVCQANDVI